MFMGAQGLVPLGLMEGDPLLIRAEQKLSTGPSGWWCSSTAPSSAIAAA